MKVLITGCCGYLGSVVARAYLEAGHSVVGFDNLRRGSESVSAILCEPRFRLVKADICDRATLESAVLACDAVVHLAAIVGSPACAAQPEEATRTNVNGTEILASLVSGRPMIYASTGSVYGEVPTRVCDEDTPAHPTTHYGATKLHSERAVMDMAGGIVLRFATAFGRSPAPRDDLLINRLVQDAKRFDRIELFEPASIRAFIHVQDIAQAVKLATLQAEGMRGQVYNVGDERVVATKRQIADLIASESGATVVERHGESDPDRRDYRMSFTKIRSLGFRATISLQEGIRELCVEGGM